VDLARETAALLRVEGKQPTVIDARFVKPLDTALLDCVAASHQCIVTIEENTLTGGFGSAVLEHLASSGIPVLRFGLPDAFVPHGDRRRLLSDVGLTPAAMAAAILARQSQLAAAG
jgi:1-deoxy-D-xylulose-5-phosphate synthase